MTTAAGVTYPVWHAFTPDGVGGPPPLAIVRGDGEMLYDEDGRGYVNGFSGLVLPCGLGRREILDAISRQLQTLAYSSLFRLTHPPAVALARRLVDLIPGDMSHVLFTTSGSEAVEAAMKVARQHFALLGEPERTRIVGLEGSYHGTSFGAMSVSGIYDEATRARYGPLVGDVELAPGPCREGRRCGPDPETCDGSCSDGLRAALEREDRPPVAAVVIEPVLAAGGVHAPARAFFDRVAELCRTHDALLVVDEAATGMGRTGHLFGSQRVELEPDVVVVAKALTGGYLPLGGAVVTARVAEPFRGGDGDAIVHHGASQSGAPAAVAAALATLDVLERDGLVARTARLGERMAADLRELAALPAVSAVRTIGLMAAIDLVDPAAPDQPPAPRFAWDVQQALMEQGLIAHVKADRVSFFPPLTISDATLARVGSILRSTLGAITANGT